MRFALQCYVDEGLHKAVKAAADAAHMSVSQWLKQVVIGTLEGGDEEAFRDRLMSHVLFASTGVEGLLIALDNKDIRTRVHVAHGKRLQEHRERLARSKRGG